MITRGMLLISHPGIAGEIIAGQTVLEKQITAVADSGITQLWIGGHKPENFPKRPLPETIRIYWVSSQNRPEEECLPPYLALSDQHLIDADELRALAQRYYQETVSYVDSQDRSVVQVITRPTEELHSSITSPIAPNSSIFLERPFSGKGVLSWAQTHNSKSAQKHLHSLFSPIRSWLNKLLTQHS